ncbi:MFS transporter [Nocardia sp. NBC_00565]|uniref:MFS transporter n=1 Tax=Nocardia sp. NBC_00565 TaxID=2975993 RepID=UPI002E80D034|nr:MFS transporter [Nocardia sp. NBC_00565]WUC07959.1 MFS transporter [Nocardia sp. NBC_00565]
MRRAYLIWGCGVAAYLIAVLQRTSFGVSGLAAADRFQVGPATLSGFVVLQVVVYAAMQIPAGLLLDRLGARAMIGTGAAIMALGQTLLASAELLPLAIAGRILVGTGDALTFISVLRLVPQWFPARRVPLISQLTGQLGQLGQILSAIPFLALLHSAGWTPAYLSAAAVGMLFAVLATAVIRNAPPGQDIRVVPAGLREIGAQIRKVWLHPGTRLGFFSHMGTQFSITTFALMWGIPYLVSAQGLSQPVAGVLLTVSVCAAMVAGPVLGVLSARYPLRRSWLVLTIMSANATVWTVVLALDDPAPVWLLALLVVVISVGGPGSMIGFDVARMFAPNTSLGTAQGMVNIGGFLATLTLIEAIGLVLEHAGGYGFDAFRSAWLLQYPIWVIAGIGVLVTRAKTRRHLATQGIHLTPLRMVIARIRTRSRD